MQSVFSGDSIHEQEGKDEGIATQGSVLWLTTIEGPEKAVDDRRDGCLAHGRTQLRIGPAFAPMLSAISHASQFIYSIARSMFFLLCG